MSRPDDGFAPQRRVNILKKVKVNRAWKFCPVVWEANGKLKDKVRVNGRTEVHNEGVYYLEWREGRQRLREAIHERSEVRERARLKALEIEARKAGLDVGPGRPIEAITSRVPTLSQIKPGENTDEGSASSDARTLIYQAVDSYFRNLVRELFAPQFRVPDETNSGGALSVPAQFPGAQFRQIAENTGTEQARVPEQVRRDQNGETKTSIAQAIDSYLKDVEPPQREPKTYEEYHSTLYRFRDHCSKVYLQDVTRDDCLDFIRYLYSIGNEARTAYNRIGIVLQLLKLHGITGLLKPRDKPKYVETMREMYQPEDLDALFKACPPDEKVRYLFFLLTGERDKEVRYTTWSDIDFNRKRVRVTAKKHLGFKPKDKEEREIPIPEALVVALKEYKARQSGPNPHSLVFPTSEGKPDKKFENKLKRIANRAGLNCGLCVSRHSNKCSKGPHCSKWFLHKFRHTFATMCLENGVSIRTLQDWLGHTDLESTMVYLKFVRRKDIHELLDNSELAGIAVNALGSSPGEAAVDLLG